MSNTNIVSAEVWTVCIILGLLMNGSVPLGMEMAADAGYPICEGTSTSIVVWLFNILSFVLLFLLDFLKSKFIHSGIMHMSSCFS